MTGHVFDTDVQAYVDGELDAGERLDFERRLRESPALADEVARLMDIKHRLRAAYHGPAIGAAPAAGMPRRRFFAPAVALLVGVLIGILGAHLARQGDAAPVVAGGAESGSMTRVLLHVGSNDPDNVREALTSARYILDDFAAAGRRVRLHVVANGKGLDMFRRRVTPFAAQIRALERRYANIRFVTCQNTIDRFEREHRRAVELLPEVLLVDSIVADIARKRVQGWLYIGV